MNFSLAKLKLLLCIGEVDHSHINYLIDSWAEKTTGAMSKSSNDMSIREKLQKETLTPTRFSGQLSTQTGRQKPETESVRLA